MQLLVFHCSCSSMKSYLHLHLQQHSSNMSRCFFAFNVAIQQTQLIWANQQFQNCDSQSFMSVSCPGQACCNLSVFVSTIRGGDMWGLLWYTGSCEFPSIPSLGPLHVQKVLVNISERFGGAETTQVQIFQANITYFLHPIDFFACGWNRTPKIGTCSVCASSECSWSQLKAGLRVTQHRTTWERRKICLAISGFWCPLISIAENMRVLLNHFESLGVQKPLHGKTS